MLQVLRLILEQRHRPSAIQDYFLAFGQACSFQPFFTAPNKVLLKVKIKLWCTANGNATVL